ncbi:hypothetical protein WJX73_004339 [Symbiochloris irregularis]|uniref:RING-type E3 ubiquitin transferase n=1 Tax=Symbiochloris irregularis TaxID=706552 RepID=A0AAW1Q1Q2_9CHLO
MEDCCVVCAEPLEWLAYASCGHREACSKCVARLRFVMQDKRCVICQQQSPGVVVTRNLGSFTQILPASEFQNLQVRVESGDLQYLPAAEAFFDDRNHLSTIRELCSYTHPDLATPGQPTPKFKSFQELERVMKGSKAKSFCRICVAGRKVFISEQITYSDADLHKHLRTGDLTGPLAESGFKGHPQCRFCHKRFYGDNEIYNHMQQEHEQCFLCRRERPDKFIYFRDYAELEDHFRQAHFACGHQICLERKFVVFASEQELRNHQGKEHGGTMSRAERRQALTVPINFQYSNVQEEAGPASGQGITIGGPNGLTSRFPRGNATRQQNASVAAATQASIESARNESVRREAAAAAAAARASDQATRDGQFNLLAESDFPQPGGPGAQAPSAARWAGAVGASATGQLRPEDFPSLPGTSKSAKRRVKEREKERQGTLAQRTAPGEVRVLNRGGAQPAAGPAAAAGGSGTATPVTASDDEPEGMDGPATQEVRPPQPSPPRAARRKLRSGSSAQVQASTPASQPSWLAAQPRPQNATHSSAEAFPALGGGAASAAAASRSNWAAVNRSADDVKAAHKALLDKVRRVLDEQSMAEFKAQSGRFAMGELQAPAYHTFAVGLGLASLIPEIAALLPDAAKRGALLAEHRSVFAAEPSSSRPNGAASSWMPPEAAAAAAEAAERQSCWRAAAEAVSGAAGPSAPVAAPQQAPVKNRWASQPGSLAQQVSSVQDAWSK